MDRVYFANQEKVLSISIQLMNADEQRLCWYIACVRCSACLIIRPCVSTNLARPQPFAIVMYKEVLRSLRIAPQSFFTHNSHAI